MTKTYRFTNWFLKMYVAPSSLIGKSKHTHTQTYFIYCLIAFFSVDTDIFPSIDFLVVRLCLESPACVFGPYVCL